MASITLDPRLLAPPDTNANAETFRAYVVRLLAWSAFAKEKGCTVTISRDAQTRLSDDGAYPLAASLRDDLKAKGISEFDFPTLKVFCEGFFRFQPCFQRHIGVTEILHDSEVFSPEIARSPRLPNTTMEAEKNLVTLALLEHCHCQTTKIGFALQTPILASHVSVSARLHDIEHSRSDFQVLGSLPQEIGGNVPVCSSLEDLAMNFDQGALFQQALNDDQMRLCIKLAIYRSRLQRNQEPEWDELPGILIGGEFRERAQRIGPLKTGLPSNIMDSIVDVYEAINERLTHALRTGAGGDNPQRSNGEFGAWRRDVASDVHLHYWKGSNGLIELSWISHPHDDFYIPQPSGK